MTASICVSERRARVVTLTHEGFSASEISGVLGITQRTVYRVRQEMGISTERVNIPLTTDELRTAAAMLDDGCSYNEVARSMGRSPWAIRQHFPGRGWPPLDGPRFGAFKRWMNKREKEIKQEKGGVRW